MQELYLGFTSLNHKEWQKLILSYNFTHIYLKSKLSSSFNHSLFMNHSLFKQRIHFQKRLRQLGKNQKMPVKSLVHVICY